MGKLMLLSCQPYFTSVCFADGVTGRKIGTRKDVFVWGSASVLV